MCYIFMGVLVFTFRCFFCFFTFCYLLFIFNDGYNDSLHISPLSPYLPEVLKSPEIPTWSVTLATSIPSLSHQSESIVSLLSMMSLVLVLPNLFLLLTIHGPPILLHQHWHLIRLQHRLFIKNPVEARPFSNSLSWAWREARFSWMLARCCSWANHQHLNPLPSWFFHIWFLTFSTLLFMKVLTFPPLSLLSLHWIHHFISLDLQSTSGASFNDDYDNHQSQSLPPLSVFQTTTFFFFFLSYLLWGCIHPFFHLISSCLSRLCLLWGCVGLTSLPFLRLLVCHFPCLYLHS